MTFSDSLDNIKARDLSIILERHWLGKSMSISTMHSKEAGDYLLTERYSAVLPSVSGFKHCRGISLFAADRRLFCW